MFGQKRVLLNVRRFKQEMCECAIAAASSLANYYDPNVVYDEARSLIRCRDRRNGLYTSQQARLLNKLGFENISIVTADLSMVDFAWRSLNKNQLIKRLKTVRAYYGRTGQTDMKACMHDLVDWLEQCSGNSLIIDYDFAKYIRRSLDHGNPVGVDVNWTSLFRFPKFRMGVRSEVTGEEDSHALVVRGYDSHGVFVVDSHSQCYRGQRLKKYRRGFYKLSWEELLVNIPRGDLVLVDYAMVN